ncbi:hypothetical protein [Geochorda subterranea]|uniref:Transposase n=1 Tax=Geochorda subterranea TaxID=3109564 RepID=A0ABZ1BQY6_9FIRM|nr:hypothetical protein [Limnochorda sp. LNt]WRP15236.1 hypothetical protein VLY81_03445 [Limnochorda sp. LNt]
MRRYIGLDVHRDYCYAHLLEAGQGEGRRLRFPNTAEGWADFVAQLGPEDAVALEVSSGAFRFTISWPTGPGKWWWWTPG